MIKQQGLNDRLHKVHERVVTPDVGHFMRKQRFDLSERKPRQCGRRQ